MPFSHIVNRDNALVTVKGWGQGSVEEAAESIVRLLDDRAILPGYGFLFEIADTTLNPTPAEMSRLVSLLRFLQVRFGGRMAVVDVRPGRMTAAILITQELDCAASPCRAFFTEREARAWLQANRAPSDRGTILRAAAAPPPSPRFAPVMG